MRAHAKYCSYRHTAGDPEPARCNCGCKCNGHPFSYWQDMAKEIVVDRLVRAATGLDGPLAALPAQLAAQRLMMLARLESSDLTDQMLQERDTFTANLAGIIGGKRAKVKP